MRGYPVNEDFYRLEELERVWAVERLDIEDWLRKGVLSVCVWLPLMSVFRRVENFEGSAVKVALELTHWEGFSSLSRHYCHRLLREGRVNLREFACADTSESYVLPDTAADVSVRPGDIVVSLEEKERFERERELRTSIGREQDSQTFRTDPSFKVIEYQEVEYAMGDIQAAVLRSLYERKLKGDPWCSGKVLLLEAGSRSYSLSNVFKRNPVWRELVHSDGRGSYRLRPSGIAVAEE